MTLHLLIEIHLHVVNLVLTLFQCVVTVKESIYRGEVCLELVECLLVFIILAYVIEMLYHFGGCYF